MASNYSSDPNNAPPGNPQTPQSNPGGAFSSNPGSVAASSYASPSVVSSGGGSGASRRLPAGTMLSNGRYKIERPVAAGGMGAVYLAIDVRFNRPCAVKEMLDEFQGEAERTQAIEWFQREATLLLDLNHPCIPRVR